MRKKIVIGLGATTAVIALSTGISGALAASVGHEQAHAVTAAAHQKITKAEARQIAKAKVPHSHVIEIESDDRHDRAGLEGHARYPARPGHSRRGQEDRQGNDRAPRRRTW